MFYFYNYNWSNIKKIKLWIQWFLMYQSMIIYVSKCDWNKEKDAIYAVSSNFVFFFQPFPFYPQRCLLRNILIRVHTETFIKQKNT